MAVIAPYRASVSGRLARPCLQRCNQCLRFGDYLGLLFPLRTEANFTLMEIVATFVSC